MIHRRRDIYNSLLRQDGEDVKLVSDAQEGLGTEDQPRVYSAR